MQIYRSLDDLSVRTRPAAVTVGNFDGIHLGHREMFRRLISRADDFGGDSVVVTFRPHPLKVLKPEFPLKLINTYSEKETLIEASGVHTLLVIPFDREFAAITPEEFVEQVLVKKLAMKHLIVGYDYGFGRDRRGNASLLRTLGEEFGYTLELLEPIGKDGIVYSSTAVRRTIEAGDVSGVVSLLGRHFSLAGSVVHGHHRGKGLGFPTANICTEKELLPKDGVYAVKVRVGEQLLDGACNVGTNPTFGDVSCAIEVFILDHESELYGKEVRLYFIERIRDERKFSGKDELSSAIADDVARCREILSATTVIGYRDYLGAD